MFGLTKIFAVVSVAAALVGAAPTVLRRQSACFVVGKIALPAEVASGIPALVSTLSNEFVLRFHLTGLLC